MNNGKFRKLTTGHLVFVHKTNAKTGMVHGYNLCSPNLRMKNYNLGQLSTSAPSQDDVSAAVKKETFYQSGKCIHHPEHVTKERYDTLIVEISGNKVEAKVPVIAES